MQLHLTEPEAHLLRQVLEARLKDDEQLRDEDRRTLTSIADRLDEATSDEATSDDAATMTRMVQITSVLTEYD